MENNFENFFNKLKATGLFKEFRSYSDWAKNKKINKLAQDIQAEIKEEIKPKPPKEKFEDTLKGEERQGYLYVFGKS